MKRDALAVLFKFRARFHETQLQVSAIVKNFTAIK